MSDYFHESMVAKMVSSNEYQKGYSAGFAIGHKQGRASRDKELAEHNVFFSNRPIEDIVLEACADERAKIISILKDNAYEVSIGVPPYEEKVVDLDSILNQIKERK